MASIIRRLYGGVRRAGLVGMLLNTSVAYATDTTITDCDVGVVPGRLVVADRLTSTGTAEVTFVAKDAGITNGRAVDVEGIRARLHVEYGDGATAGAFVIPPGTTSGWVRNDPAMTRYRNADAPSGATEMHSIVLRPRRLVKLRGAGRGDTPLDIAGVGPPMGSIYVSLEIVEAGITTRLCSEVQDCGYRAITPGAAKLTCSGGIADPSCRAAHPVYLSAEEVRYGGAGTVAIIGDSITVQSRGALTQALADSWFTHVRAKSGSMFRELQRAAERIGDSNPQVVVINLGTNDVACVLWNAFTPDTPCRFPDFGWDDLLNDARAMVASVAGACVIGTTTWFGNAVGQLWSDMVTTGELAGVVRWQEFLDSLSTSERELLLADSLGHLTTAGTVALAEMTAQVIVQSCGVS